MYDFSSYSLHPHWANQTAGRPGEVAANGLGVYVSALGHLGGTPWSESRALAMGWMGRIAKLGVFHFSALRECTVAICGSTAGKCSGSQV